MGTERKNGAVKIKRQFVGPEEYSSFVFEQRVRSALERIFDHERIPVTDDACDAIWGPQIDRKRTDWLDGLEQAANWAWNELKAHEKDLTRGEADEELRMLRRLAESPNAVDRLHKRLKNISPTVDKLIGLEFNPSEFIFDYELYELHRDCKSSHCLERQREKLRSGAISGLERLDGFRKTRKKELHDWIAEELLIRVKETFDKVGMSFSATYMFRVGADIQKSASRDYYLSAAVETITLIAGSLGLLQQSSGTWKNRIAKLKNGA